MPRIVRGKWLKGEGETTHVFFVMDRSGSMSCMREAAVGGYNEFVRKQKEEPGEATFSLAQFDNEYELLQDWVPISKAREYTADTFIPRGGTALLDAIGRSMAVVEEKVRSMELKDRPKRVVFAVMTDGCENASREFTQDMVSEKIKEWDGIGWKVLFLSSEPRAIMFATQSLHVPDVQTFAFAPTNRGMSAGFSALCSSVGSYRSGGSADLTDVPDDEWPVVKGVRSSLAPKAEKNS